MQEKIKNYFSINNINITIKNIIKSLQVTKYYIKIDNITPLQLNKIEKMKKSICLYLQIDNINISFDNVTGCIILEIPTQERSILTYDELIKDYKKQNDGLYCNIGINTENKIKQINICELPHLLIAGTTGSRKKCFD